MTKILSIITILIGFIVSSVSVDVSDANAQTLLEAIFSNSNKQKEEEQEKLRQKEEEEELSEKKYFEYEPRRVVNVDFEPLARELRRDRSRNRRNAQAERTKKGQRARDLSDKKIPLDTIAYIINHLQTDMSAHHQSFQKLQMKAREDVADAMIQHYKKHPKFLWVNINGKPNSQAVDALKLLQDADEYGLDGGHYKISNDGVLGFEISMTLNALQYIVDAKHGIVNPNGISVYHDLFFDKPDTQKMMSELAKTANKARLMIGAHPKSPEFTALKNELNKVEAVRLKKYSKQTVVITKKIPNVVIRPGDENAELQNVMEAIKLRINNKTKRKYARLLEGEHQTYDKQLIPLIKDVQKRLFLGGDGIIGPNTLSRLYNPSKQQIEHQKILQQKYSRIVLAMERLRWLPDELGQRYVFVNQPAFEVTLMNQQEPELNMKVVVGTKEHQTNFFHDQIEYVEFNPYWNVPQSILINEMLPELVKNPVHLDAEGFEMINQNGEQVASAQVNWTGVEQTFPYHVRQPPGPLNALGALKIMFPNQHSIYMHDTPQKELFGRKVRAFSHGCIRLQKPNEMAAAILKTKKQDIIEAIKTEDTHKKYLNQTMPIYVAYFTAWPNQNNQIRYYDDIYDRDIALSKAIEAEKNVRSWGYY